MSGFTAFLWTCWTFVWPWAVKVASYDWPTIIALMEKALTAVKAATTVKAGFDAILDFLIAIRGGVPTTPPATLKMTAELPPSQELMNSPEAIISDMKARSSSMNAERDGTLHVLLLRFIELLWKIVRKPSP